MRNVSKSPDFAVYRFLKDGVAYVQINRLDGTVVGAVALADGISYALPIGRLSAQRLSLLQPGQTRPLVATAAGVHQCPCQAQVVFVGPNATVIVVTDRDGNVIQIVTIPHKQTASTAP